MEPPDERRDIGAICGTPPKDCGFMAAALTMFCVVRVRLDWRT